MMTATPVSKLSGLCHRVPHVLLFLSGRRRAQSLQRRVLCPLPSLGTFCVLLCTRRRRVPGGSAFPAKCDRFLHKHVLCPSTPVATHGG